MKTMPHVILNIKWRWRWHQTSLKKKWRRHDDLSVTVNDAAPWYSDAIQLTDHSMNDWFYHSNTELVCNLYTHFLSQWAVVKQLSMSMVLLKSDNCFLTPKLKFHLGCKTISHITLCREIHGLNGKSCLWCNPIPYSFYHSNFN